MGISLNRYLDGAPFDGAVGEIVSEVIFCGESLAAVFELSPMACDSPCTSKVD
jgi:hypothetical protein